MLKRYLSVIILLSAIVGCGTPEAGPEVTDTNDTVSPVLAVLSVSNNGTCYSTASGLLVEGTASDSGSGVSKVYVSVNGEPFVLAGGTLVWSRTFARGEGVYSFKAYAVDAAGNQSPTNEITNVRYLYKVTASGRLSVVSGFYSPGLHNVRSLRIYVPQTYSNSSGSYPVLYMHDGQNIFAPGGTYGCWYVERAYDKLVSSNLIREALIVGIDNTYARIDEYTPTYDSDVADGGNGEAYVNFILQDVIPYVGSNYRVLTGPTNTAIMGSSLGGLISFYAAWNHPEVFGYSGCMSSSFWWDYQDLLKQVLDYTGIRKDIKFWIDSGNNESEDEYYEGYFNYIAQNGVDDMAEDAMSMANRLVEIGWTNAVDVMFDIDYTGTHSESSWSARVYKPLLFFFGKDPMPVPDSLSASLSVSSIGENAVPYCAAVFAKAYYSNDMFAEVPLTSMVIDSPLLDLISISNYLIYPNKNNVTVSTQLTLDVIYGSLTDQCVLNIAAE